MWPLARQQSLLAHDSFRVADHQEDGQTIQYKRVYRYRSGETATFPQRDFWLAIVCDSA
jgi:hypothetical protein